VKIRRDLANVGEISCCIPETLASGQPENFGIIKENRGDLGKSQGMVFVVGIDPGHDLAGCVAKPFRNGPVLPAVRA